MLTMKYLIMIKQAFGITLQQQNNDYAWACIQGAECSTETKF